MLTTIDQLCAETAYRREPLTSAWQTPTARELSRLRLLGSPTRRAFRPAASQSEDRPSVGPAEAELEVAFPGTATGPDRPLLP